MKKVLVYYEPETGTNGTGGTPAPTGAPYIPTQAPTDGATPISGTYDYVAGNSPYSQIKSVAAAPTPAPVPTGAPYIPSPAPTSSPVAGESIAPGTSAPTPGTYDYVIQNGPFSQITSGTPAPTTRTGAPYIPSPTPTSTASSATSTPTSTSTQSSQSTYMVNNQAYSGGTLKGADKVLINGKEYSVTGYATLTNGDTRVVYAYQEPGKDAEYYYVGSDGTFQPARKDGKWCIEGYTNIVPTLGTFEPSETDKKFLSGGSYSAPSPTLAPTETKLYNYEKYDLNSKLVKRKSYTTKISMWKFYQKDETTWAQYDTATVVEEGPNDAKDKNVLARETYNLTPGQGQGAKESAIEFETNIGHIRRLLTSVRDDTMDVLYMNQHDGPPPELRSQAWDIIEKLDGITKTVYENYIYKSLDKVVDYCIEKQKKENEYTETDTRGKAANKNNAVQNYWKTYGWHFNTSNNYKKPVYETTGKDIAHPAVSSGYIDKDYTRSVTGGDRSSLYCNPGSETTFDNRSSGTKGLYANITGLKIIVDNLEIANNKYVKLAKQTIDDQVAAINKIESYTTAVGTLKPETIYGDFFSTIESDIKNLKNKYEKIIEEIQKNKSDDSSGSSGNNRNNSNGGNRSTGGSNTPEPTTKAILIGSTPSPSATTTPTPTPTPTATATPTPSLTQGPLPVDNPSGGGISNGNGNNNGNGNSNGGVNYTNGVQWTGGENPVTTPTVTETPIEVATSAPVEVEEDNLIIGKKYNIPTSTKTIATTPAPSSRSGNAVIPVVAGIGAAAAAGIGAKAYIDRKKNRNNGEENNFTAEDWSEDNKVDIKYSEPLNNEETLEFDA